ncbi:MAG: hypothetical protein PHP50_03370 [Lachnospiraceae bacterium]|nr:hypothetical protein [Lachnospiraceae bacterium]
MKIKNSDIEFCEVYNRQVKEQVRKALVYAGVSYCIKIHEKENNGINSPFGRKEVEEVFRISVNKKQKKTAEHAVIQKVERVEENVVFLPQETLQSPRTSWKQYFSWLMI